MAKLARATQKIFGDNAPNTQITAFGTAMTDSPVYTRDVNTIMNNNYLTGWASAILADKSPYEEDTNGVLYAITRQLAYIYNEGIPEYDANTSYPIGAIVKSVSNNTINIYLSLVNNNAGYPLTNTTYWKLAPIGNVQQQLDNAVKLTGNQTVAGDKTWTGANTFSGTTKVPASANDGTALQNTKIFKGANGYVKLGNGLIIQWGKTGDIAQNTATAVTLPTAFSSSNYKVVSTPDFTEGQTWPNSSAVSSLSSTSFKIWNYRHCYDHYYNMKIQWIAIGY